MHLQRSHGSSLTEQILHDAGGRVKSKSPAGRRAKRRFARGGRGDFQPPRAHFAEPTFASRGRISARSCARVAAEIPSPAARGPTPADLGPPLPDRLKGAAPAPPGPGGGPGAPLLRLCKAPSLCYNPHPRGRCDLRRGKAPGGARGDNLEPARPSPPARGQHMEGSVETC
jgi:hypothetical protein